MFGAESLDGICAYSLLHLLPDRSTVLQRIHGLLKPGGFFVSSTVCLRESRVPFAPIIRVMRWLGKAPLVVNSFDRATIGRDIRDAGFVNVTQPDVGAKRVIAFVVARKPPRRRHPVDMASQHG